MYREAETNERPLGRRRARRRRENHATAGNRESVAGRVVDQSFPTTPGQRLHPGDCGSNAGVRIFFLHIFVVIFGERGSGDSVHARRAQL